MLNHNIYLVSEHVCLGLDYCGYKGTNVLQIMVEWKSCSLF